MESTLESMFKNVFKLRNEKDFEVKYTSQIASREKTIFNLFQKRGLLPNTRLVQNVLSLEESLRYGSTIVLLGVPYNGKSLCLDVLLELQSKSYEAQGIQLRTLRLNPSILNISNEGYYISELLDNIFVEDNLEFVLRRIAQANSKALHHCLLFDGPMEVNLWDLLSNLAVQRGINAQKDFDSIGITDENQNAYSTENVQFGTNVRNINGKVYHFEKNITTFIETDNLSELTPSSLPFFVIINFDSAINTNQMLELLSLKFFNTYAKSLKIPSFDIVKEAIKDTLFPLIEKIASEFLDKPKKLTLKGFLLSLFQVLAALAKNSKASSTDSAAQSNPSSHRSNASSINNSLDIKQDPVERRSQNKVVIPTVREDRTKQSSAATSSRQYSRSKPALTSQVQRNLEPNSSLTSKILSYTQSTSPSLTLKIEMLGIISLIWTLAATLDFSERKSFISTLKEHLSSRIASNEFLKEKFEGIQIESIFEYHYDFSTERFVKYSSSAFFNNKLANTCFMTDRRELFVPTWKNLELIYCWTLSAQNNNDFAIHGSDFSGKTSALWFLKKWVQETSLKDTYEPITLANFRKSEINILYERIMERFVETKPGCYRLGNKKLPLFIIDDVSINTPCEDNELPTGELIKFWKKNRGIYSALTNKFYNLGAVNFVVAIRDSADSEKHDLYKSRTYYEYFKYNLENFEDEKALQSVFKGLIGFSENPKIILTNRDKVAKLVIDLFEENKKLFVQSSLSLKTYQFTEIIKNLLHFTDNTDFIKYCPILL